MLLPHVLAYDFTLTSDTGIEGSAHTRAWFLFQSYLLKYTNSLSVTTKYCGRHSITKVDCCRFLGVAVDEELKWTAHYEQLYSNLIKFSYIFYKLQTLLPEHILKQILFRLCTSTCFVWT